ncbi:MAG TPA: hypothetical protein VIT22_03730 [Pseudoxanthomonas sp.]
MKVFLKIAIVSLGLLLLSACASTQKTAYGGTPIQNEKMVTDLTYMAMVENIARQRGTKVMWVNAPKKRVVEVAANPE